MRYELPQFINIEDKIFGPFTFRQFVYLAGGAGASYAMWELLPTIIAIIIIVPIIGLSLGLAFYKVNNRPFIDILYAAVSHAFGKKFYLWQQRRAQASDHKQPVHPTVSNIQQSSGKNLREISWGLDILDMQDPNANRDRK